MLGYACEQLLAHRGRAKAASSKPPEEHVAKAPLEVWSWDITYLRSEVAGKFYYLYLHVDVWSRKIVGRSVNETECGELATAALNAALQEERIDGQGLVLHQDNGSPMKGATLKATTERLGVIASYSRPRVSDDNPYSESLFRTLKYRPEYPRRPFASVEEACAWVRGFVAWYNHEHLHSGIGFVTPAERHAGRAETILAARRTVYARAYRRNPGRWSGAPRAWKHPAKVRLRSTARAVVDQRDNAAANTCPTVPSVIHAGQILGQFAVATDVIQANLATFTAISRPAINDHFVKPIASRLASFPEGRVVDGGATATRLPRVARSFQSVPADIANICVEVSGARGVFGATPACDARARHHTTYQ